MKADQSREAGILQSWSSNVQPWVNAVREGQISTRLLTTNQAIIDAIVQRSPASVLDIGCGEGWLSRELSGRNIHTIGIDAVAGLIQAARRAGAGDFRVMAYAELAAARLEMRVDTIACNFSLLGLSSTAAVLTAATGLLKPGGCIVVQTLHPLQACGEHAYIDGWREGSWQGFSSGFCNPPPWYFRTLESWIKLFASSALQLLEIREPLDPRTGKPASVIFIAEPCRATA